MFDWSGVKRILCIRPDNMGDLLMSGPAIRALKQGLNAHIAVLTSSMGAVIAPYMPEIDEVITFDLPWVKTNATSEAESLNDLISLIREKKFDAAVIFTVYSQSPLPSAMIAYQAGIPNVLAYCRENPYGLIADWVVDKEPFDRILPQVERDLMLVSKVCPLIDDKQLRVRADESYWPGVSDKLTALGVDLQRPWLILHPGVSELKRQFPEDLWVDIAKQLIERGWQIIITGSAGDTSLTDRLKSAIGSGAYNTAGMFSIAQLIALIKSATLLLSVNTGTVHIAAAVGTPVVVLYAQTNPQHTPWLVPHKVIEFPVPAQYKSKNTVIAFVDKHVYAQPTQMPTPAAVIEAVLELVNQPVE